MAAVLKASKLAIPQTNRKKTERKNELIKFNDKEVKDPKEIANSFNKEFARSCHVEKSKVKRQNKRLARKVEGEDYIVSTKMIDEALKLTTNSKALGPNGITSLQQKKTEYIAGLATLSLSCCRIEVIWKQAIVIPLLKPADQAFSYRLVSLLSPVACLFERILPVLITTCKQTITTCKLPVNKDYYYL